MFLKFRMYDLNSDTTFKVYWEVLFSEAIFSDFEQIIKKLSEANLDP